MIVQKMEWKGKGIVLITGLIATGLIILLGRRQLRPQETA